MNVKNVIALLKALSKHDPEYEVMVACTDPVSGEIYEAELQAIHVDKSKEAIVFCPWDERVGEMDDDEEPGVMGESAADVSEGAGNPGPDDTTAWLKSATRAAVAAARVCSVAVPLDRQSPPNIYNAIREV